MGVTIAVLVFIFSWGRPTDFQKKHCVDCVVAQAGITNTDGNICSDEVTVQIRLKKAAMDKEIVRINEQRTASLKCLGPEASLYQVNAVHINAELKIKAAQDKYRMEIEALGKTRAWSTYIQPAQSIGRGNTLKTYTNFAEDIEPPAIPKERELKAKARKLNTSLRNRSRQ